MSKTTTKAVENESGINYQAESGAWFFKNKGDNESIWQKVFWGLCLAMILSLGFLSQDTAVNADDRWHVRQGEYSWKFYSSFGKDRSFMIPAKEGGALLDNAATYEYGCFTEILCVLANKIAGNDPQRLEYYQLRYLIVSLIGFIGMLFAALLVKRFSNWLAGCIALLFIFCSPYFTGHALINPKDLPLASFYMMSIYYMVEFFSQFPKPKWSTSIWLAIAFGLGLGMRVGNLLIGAYFVLFSLIAFFFKKDFELRNKGSLDWKDYLMKSAVVLAGGYVIGLLFWPYGLIAPLSHPFEVLSGQSNYDLNLGVIFDGQEINSKELPWNYIPQWIFITTPLIILLGLPMAVMLLLNKWKDKYQFSLIALIVFSFVFPVLYVIYKHSPLYCGWRHMLFVYPSLVVFCTLGWWWLVERFKNKKVQMALTAFLALALIQPALFIFKNTNLSFVYTNMSQGGPSDSYGQWEQDYWMISMKQACNYLLEKEKLSERKDTVYIRTDCYFPVEIYLRDVPNVVVNYSTYTSRYDFSRHPKYDYGLFFARYVDLKQLQKKKWPPKNALYNVKVDDAILATVYRCDERIYQAKSLMGQTKNGDRSQLTAEKVNQAIDLMKAALADDPNNEMLYVDVAQVFGAIGRNQEAQEYMNSAQSIAPGLFKR